MSYARLRSPGEVLRYFLIPMKHKPSAPAPAITPQALAVAAGRKARRVQKKLHEAETEMHTANEALAHGPHAKEVDEAMRRNADAERKVHEAVEELEVVKEMLEHADPKDLADPAERGKTGQGVKSLLPHLKRKA
jgi:hypothetical protein